MTGVAMLTHGKIWSAIDALARRYGLSPSGLAKRAGLDATAFNRSKRVTPEGRARWPTTESLAKVLAATGASVEEFVDLLDAETPRIARMRPQPIPLIGFTQAGGGGFFDDGGFPVGGGWDQIRFPRVDDDNAYALEVTGDSMAAALPRGGHPHRLAQFSPTQRRPRGGSHHRRRGHGEGAGAAHAEDRGARLVQPGPCQSRLPDRAHRLDGAHRLGQPIAGGGDEGPRRAFLAAARRGRARFLPAALGGLGAKSQVARNKPHQGPAVVFSANAPSRPAANTPMPSRCENHDRRTEAAAARQRTGRSRAAGGTQEKISGARRHAAAGDQALFQSESARCRHARGRCPHAEPLVIRLEASRRARQTGLHQGRRHQLALRGESERGARPLHPLPRRDLHAAAGRRTNEFAAQCSVMSQDLAAWLVRRGWALPQQDAEPELAEAMEAAKTDGLGLWRSGASP